VEVERYYGDLQYEETESNKYGQDIIHTPNTVRELPKCKG